MKFNLDLLKMVLAPIMPLVTIENEMIMLGTVERITAENDGSLRFYFASGSSYLLNTRQAKILSTTLENGIKEAQKIQRQQRAAEMFSVKPGIVQ